MIEKYLRIIFAFTFPKSNPASTRQPPGLTPGGPREDPRWQEGKRKGRSYLIRMIFLASEVPDALIL
jgi:hypothetical protein